eukprot:362070-Chlamydomonas_euryale.AAC.20
MSVDTLSTSVLCGRALVHPVGVSHVAMTSLAVGLAAVRGWVGYVPTKRPCGHRAGRLPLPVAIRVHARVPCREAARVDAAIAGARASSLWQGHGASQPIF